MTGLGKKNHAPVDTLEPDTTFSGRSKLKCLLMVLFALAYVTSLPVDSSGFNGDGYADLVIGIPDKIVSGANDAGRVNVIYGAFGGLTSIGSENIQQDQPDANIEAYRAFGTAVAVGDFNGDRCFDLAVGVPGQEVNGLYGAGAVQVIYNSCKSGLDTSNSQYWDQNSTDGEGRDVEGDAEQGDGFGNSLTAGDFNGDGYSDLAIGIINETIDSIEDAGGVQVMYGSAHGITADGNVVLGQGSDAGNGEQYGFALAVGNFDNDDYDDLAVGVPTDDVEYVTKAGEVGPIRGAGGVNLYYGGPAGITSGNRTDYWHQDRQNVEGTAESGDYFGYSITTGDFNNDTYDDLAVGVIGEGIGDPVAFQAGAVNILYGSADGITSYNNQMWHQNSSGVAGEAESWDIFGASLTAGDFNGDGCSELAIGIPKEDIDSLEDVGMVQILIGSEDGLKSDGRPAWHQDGPDDLLDEEESGDLFGAALCAGDFNHDGYEDLVVGVPGEDINIPETINVTMNAGLINVIYGTYTGLTVNGNQIWYQGYNGLPGTNLENDSFGSVLVVAPSTNINPPPSDHHHLSPVLELLLLGD